METKKTTTPKGTSLVDFAVVFSIFMSVVCGGTVLISIMVTVYSPLGSLRSALSDSNPNVSFNPTTLKALAAEECMKDCTVMLNESFAVDVANDDRKMGHQPVIVPNLTVERESDGATTATVEVDGEEMLLADFALDAIAIKVP